MHTQLLGGLCASTLLLTGGCGLFPDVEHLGGGRRTPVPCSAPQYVKSSAPRTSALFGASVAGDADTIVVTAPTEMESIAPEPESLDPLKCPRKYPPSSAGAGVVRVFERAADGWAEQRLTLSGANGISPLLPSDAFPPNSLYSQGVFPTFTTAISNGRIAVGAAGDSSLGSFRGSVRIFSRVRDVWAEAPFRIQEQSSRDGDLFGLAVALSGDTLVVGAPGEDVDGKDSGGAYVYQLGPDGVSRGRRLAPPSPEEQAWFGLSVAAFGDWIAVGAPGKDRDLGLTGGSPDVGAVYLYASKGGSDPQPIVPTIDVVGAMTFGTKVALASDVLAVGAPFSSGCSNYAGDLGRGVVVLYSLSGGVWTDERCVDARVAAPSNPDPPSDLLSSLFGFDLALDSDSLAVGAPFSEGFGGALVEAGTDAPVDSQGATYVFRGIHDAAPTQVCRLNAPNPDACDAFGSSIAFAGANLVVGASGEDGNASGIGSAPDSTNRLMDSGAFYVFSNE